MLDLPQNNIEISIPTNHAGTVPTRVSIHVPLDISFRDLHNRICAHMDIHPDNAQLGFKFHTDLVRDLPRRLSNEDDLRAAMEMAAGFIRRARTRRVVMNIHNLVGIDTIELGPG